MGGRGGHPEVPEAATAAANCQSPPESGLSTELGGAGTGSDLQVSARGRGGLCAGPPGPSGLSKTQRGQKTTRQDVCASLWERQPEETVL